MIVSYYNVVTYIVEKTLQLHIMEVYFLLVITCSESPIKTLDQGVKYVQF